MDITSFSLSDEPVKYVVLHPVTGDKTDIILHLAGFHDPAVKAVNRTFQKKIFDAATRKEQLPDDVLDNQVIFSLVECIKGWENLSFNGQPLEFNKKNAKMILEKMPWLKEQVEAFCGERANFFMKP